MRELRRLASQGIPDAAGIRSTLWKVLISAYALFRFCGFRELKI